MGRKSIHEICGIFYYARYNMLVLFQKSFVLSPGMLEHARCAPKELGVRFGRQSTD
jgi:hypothetical protein